MKRVLLGLSAAAALAGAAWAGHGVRANPNAAERACDKVPAASHAFEVLGCVPEPPPAPAPTCDLSAEVLDFVVILNYTTYDATSAVFDNGMGEVPTGSGTLNIFAPHPMTITLTVTGPGGVGSCQVYVEPLGL